MADKYLENLDFTLRKIVNARNGVSKLNVENEEATFLTNEKLIRAIEDRYVGTSQGKIFVSKGGYTGKSKRVKRERTFQMLFWIANICSLLASMYFYYQSKKYQVQSDQKKIELLLPDQIILETSNGDSTVISVYLNPVE